MRRLRFVSLTVAALLTGPGAAQENGGELRRCAELADDAERLACYDRAMGRPGSADASARGVPATPPTAEAAPPAARSEADAAARFGLPDRKDEAEPDEITATIVRIDTRANRERIFTLDNGQVWVEDAPVPSLRLKEGDTVRIKSGLFGSYRLFGSGNRSSGVDRVR